VTDAEFLNDQISCWLMPSSRTAQPHLTDSLMTAETQMFGKRLASTRADCKRTEDVTGHIHLLMWRLLLGQVNSTVTNRTLQFMIQIPRYSVNIYSSHFIIKNS